MNNVAFLYRMIFGLPILLVLTVCDNSQLTENKVQTVAALHRQINPGPDFANLIARLQPRVLNVRAGVTARGSAFVAHPEGYLLTALHVVQGVEEINVTLESDESIEAVVAATNKTDDIALLKIDMNPDWQWKALDIHGARNVRLGEWLVVLGNPFGQGLTVSVGVVGSVGKTLSKVNRAVWIQTDASINPGNSGGPVISSGGQVIGVATAHISLGQGVGFITPIESGRRLLSTVLDDR